MKTTFFGLAFIFLVFIDQTTKIASGIVQGDSSFIHQICNNNLAWSVPVQPVFFYPIWFAIIFILFKYYSELKNAFKKLSVTLILSGALSNMIDRAAKGCVTDFLDLKIWPVFNLADVYISIGIILLALNFIKIIVPRSGTP